MTLKTLIARLRASLSFGGFRDGGAVHKTEAQETLEDLRKLRADRLSSTLPPRHLLEAERKASGKLAHIRREIRRHELQEQADEMRLEMAQRIGEGYPARGNTRSSH